MNYVFLDTADNTEQKYAASEVIEYANELESFHAESERIDIYSIEQAIKSLDSHGIEYIRATK